MRKFFSVMGAVAAVAATLAWTQAPRGQSPGTKEVSYVEGQVIVALDPAAGPNRVQALRSALNASVKRVFPSIGGELWEFEGMSVPDAVKLLQNEPGLRYAEPNYIGYIDAIPDDPRFPELWGMDNTGQTGGTPDADIDAPEAWDTATGGEVIIGVLDTGVDWQHVDLADNIYENPGEIAGNGIDDDGNGFVDDVHGWDFANDDNNPMDDYGHGTHCAGTIAGIGNNGIGVAGVCWTAKILPIKWITASGNGTESDVIASVEYATLMGARVTSNSWWFPYSLALKDAIAAAGEAGFIFVSSAGNSDVDTDISPQYPACYDLDNIISVAATTHTDAKASFSNYGLATVDLGAPGEDILSCLPSNSYGLASGTSMAAPHVAGAAGLVWSIAPNMNRLEVKELILGTVDPTQAMEGRTVSGGRLNVLNMVSGLDSIPPAPVSDLAVASTSSNTVTLTWTASGDDTTTGTARTYDIRYSFFEITPENWDAATPAAGTPRPNPSGSVETFEVAGLDFNTAYYFGLVVADEQDNRSPLSNVCTGTTLGIPSFAADPDSLEDDLFTGESSAQYLTISNVGEGTLDFVFPAGTPAGSAAAGAPATLPPWIRVEPASGRVNAGENAQVAVTFDAFGLMGGVYTHGIVIETNDPANPAAVIFATLNVTNAPDIVVSRSAIDWGLRFTGTSTPDTLVVSNSGVLDLVVTGVAIDNAEFATDPAGFSLEPGASRTLTVTYSPLSPGTAAGTLSIESDDPDEPAKSVSLSATSADPPVISVDPAALDENLFTGEVSERTLTIANLGAYDLSYDIALVEESSGPTLRVTRAAVADDPSAKPWKDRTPASAAPGAGGDDPAARWSGTRGDANPPQKTVRPPVRIANVTGAALDLILVHTAYEPWAIQTDLLSFPDIETVDLFDASSAAPPLETLLDYDAAILIANAPWGDAYVLGDVLADYVDEGGGVIMTVASFIGSWAVQGRFLDEGYYPFAMGGGPTGPADLGSFDASHPIMKDVTSAWGDLLGTAAPAPGAVWVADWTNGETLVATQGEHVAGVNVFLDSDYFYAGDVPLILHNAALWAAGISWLAVDPTAGVVPPGSAVDLDVTFDAAGLYGGDYNAGIVIANNDPFNPEVRVPAHLHVTGAPDIDVTPTLIEYGPVFVGAAVHRTLTIENTGTDVLFVSDISSDDAQYTVDATNFSLAPQESRAVEVAFAPSTVGPVPGTLTITSDDVDEPVVAVTLSGVGLEPPVISVSPDALADSLFTGETSSHALAISNAGGNDLVWQARVAGREEQTAKSYALTAPIAGKADPETGKVPTAGGYRTTAISAVLQDLTGVHIVWDRAHGQSESVYWSVIFSDLANRGATIEENFDAFTPALLEDYDLLWTVDFYTAWTPSEIQAVQDWVRGGGALLFESDEVPIEINAILSGLATGIGYLATPGSWGTTTAIYPHETTENVAAVYLDNPISTLSVLAPATLLVDDAGGHHTAACAEAARGRIAAVSDEVFADWVVGGADNQLFGNQLVDWLATGVDWLEVSPANGTVAPLSTEEITVTFDAAGLYGGDYEAEVFLSNNDPIHPEVGVPVFLHVTGAPDIDVALTIIDYGPVFIGAAARRTLTIKNAGTDVLDVSDISTDDAQYTVDATSFSLAPEESRDVEVTFAPAAAGTATGTLTITSNDVDEPQVAVALTGEGLEPPVISVAPDTLADSLYTGETSTQGITIQNTGASPLEFRIFGETSGSPEAALRALNEKRREGDALPQTAAPLENGRERYAARSAAGTDAGFRHAPLPPADPAVMDVYRAIASILAESTLVFFDDMESGENGWTHYATGASGMDLWGLSTDRSSSAVTSWRVRQHDIAGSDALESPPVDMTRLESATLVFKHWYNFDDCDDPSFEPDGGIVEISMDGGATWAQIFPVGGYPYTLDDICDNPLAYFDAYSHDGGDGDLFVPAVFDLSAYAGSVVSIRFQAGWDCGNCSDNEGWYIDDVAVYSRGLVWLSANPAEGTVPPGSSLDAEVTFDAAGLYGGDYEGNLVVVSNDPITPEARVKALLHVTGAPDIDVALTLIDYGPVFIGAVVPRTLAVKNTGTDVLNVSAVSISEPQYTADATSFSLEPGAGRQIEVSFAPTIVGPVPGTLIVTSDDPDEPAIAVALTGEGLAPPVVSVAPDTLSEALFTGGVTTRTMTIQNLGANELSFGIAIEEADTARLANGLAWLYTDPAEGTVPPGSAVDVEVTFDARGVYGGDYDADIIVASNDPITPEVRVKALLHVTGAPDIGVSQGTVDFGQVYVGTAAQDTLVVSNTGTDVLDVTGVSSDEADYTVGAAGFSIAPGQSLGVEISFAPTRLGAIPGTLTIESNDPDEPVITVALEGAGIAPPVFEVSCTSIADSLPVGGASAHGCTVKNAGGLELRWAASVRYAGDTGGVLESSPVFASGGPTTDDKRAAASPPGRPGPEEVFTSAARGAGTAAPVSAPSLELVLANLNSTYSDLVSTIPSRFDFAEGETGVCIVEGGADMFDGGNYLSTDIGGYIEYSNNAIADSPYFGNGGRYFTRKYPGLFVLAADMDGVGHFEITGDLGADNVGSADGVVLQLRVADTNFYGFVKRVYGASDPSVNHLIIIEEHLGAGHEFSTHTNDDYHRVFNLSGSGRIYYLLYARNNGGRIGDEETLAIMRAFVACARLVPEWARVTPLSGALPPGAAMDVSVAFEASVLVPGDYDADLVMTSNDPLRPEAVVPLHLRVVPSTCGVPDIVSADPPVVNTANCENGCTVDFTVETPVGYPETATLTLERYRDGAWTREDSLPAPLPGPVCTLSCVFDAHYTDGQHLFRAVIHCGDGSGGVSEIMAVLADRGVPVLFRSFEPLLSGDGVVLRWALGDGSGVSGFNVYRADRRDGEFERLNAELVPAREGGEYTDRSVTAGATYWYRLGAVDAEGEWMSQTVSISVPAASLALYQNVPNPFNPTTSIAFSLPDRARASLSVYDVQGRHVKTLADEVFEAGVRRAEWDATDERGTRVGSGIYFYRLTVGGKSITKKMILLK